MSLNLYAVLSAIAILIPKSIQQITVLSAVESSYIITEPKVAIEPPDAVKDTPLQE
jgi:hypothetical protein